MVDFLLLVVGFVKCASFDWPLPLLFVPETEPANDFRRLAGGAALTELNESLW